jgi:hypothetical protein
MKGTPMKITQHSASLASLLLACDSEDGTTTDIHRARAEYRGGMWHVYPVVTQDFTYSSTSLKNAAEYWENDLRKGTKPWEISK